MTITAEMLEPITTAINSGITTIVPIGIAAMAAMVGMNLIPKIIYRFI